MVKIVEITQSSDTVTCDEKGQAAIVFTVKNIRPSPLRIGAKIITEGQAQSSWFKPDGPSEKSLNSTATDQFSWKIDAKDAPEGTYKVHLLVYSIENSEEDYTESETIAVNVPAPVINGPTPPKSNLWIVWLLVGILVAALLGVIAYLALKDKKDTVVVEPQTVTITLASIPDVKGKSFENAKAELENLEFKNIQTKSQFNATTPKNTVLGQTPDAFTKADPQKTEIVLVLADSTTTMPDVKDRTLQGAKDLLAGKGFTKIKTVPKFDLSKPVKTVLDQSPAAETSASANETEVTLTIADAGVVVPNVINQSLTNALFTLNAAKLALGTPKSEFRADLNEGTVIGQTPQSGNVPEKTEIALVVSTKQPPNRFSPILLQQTIRDSRISVNPRVLRQLETQ